MKTFCEPMKLDVHFDMKPLQEAFRSYMDHTKRSLPYVLEKQTTQLAIGAKGVKGLFQEALSTRPATVADIKAARARLGYRIRRAKGMTVANEIKRRISKAGYFQGSGWLTRGIATSSRFASQLQTLRGRIVTRFGGLNPSITLINTSPKAAEFGARTGYIQRAINSRARDMLKYVRKNMASDAKIFSMPKPRFPSNINAQLDKLLKAA